MFSGPLNYLAVLVAAVVYFIIGAVWFAAPVFGKTWMKELGKKEEDFKSGMAQALITGFFCSVLIAYTLARVLQCLDATLADGIMGGFMMGVGFVAAVMLIHKKFERGSMTLFWIDSLYHVVSFMIMGVILAVWK